MKRLSAVFIYLLTSFFSTAGAYTTFEENGKIGLKNASGIVLIPAVYDAIGWSNGEFSLSGKVTGYSLNKQWGLIDLENNKITPPRYETLRAVEGHLIIAQIKLNYAPWLATGCIKEDGKEVIPFVYDGISVSSLRAIVYSRISGQYKYGLVDLNNRSLIPQQYKSIRSVGTLRYVVQNFDNKTALYTENGKQISGFTIDSLSDFQKDYAVIFEGKHQGLINRDGQLKLPVQYRDIIIDNEGKIKARKADEWFFLDGQNKQIRQLHADSVIALHKDRLKIKTANHTQLTDKTLEPIQERIFTNIERFSGNKAVYRLENRYGVLAYDGSIILPPLYRQIEIGKNYIIANQHTGGKDAWVLFDSLGVKQTQKAYELMKPFDAYFAVHNRGAWGIINQTGKEIIACTYDSIMQSSHGLFVVKFRGAYGIINASEAWKTAPKADKLFIINEDRYIAYSSTTTFLKSMNGTVIYFTTNPIEIHEDYFLEFLPSGNIWQIDMKGVIANRQVIPQETYEKIFEESEGYRAIKRNGRYGFIDSRGRLRIANRYEEVQKFSDGFAAIKILNKWGFINQQDNISVQPIYDEVWPFKRGYALVRQKDFFGLIDQSGKQVLPARYDKIDVLATGNLLIKVNGLHGLADGQGKIFIHPKYNSITDLGNAYVIAVRDNKYGVITNQGISTIPMLYDYISYDAYNNVFLALKKSEWINVNF